MALIAVADTIPAFPSNALPSQSVPPDVLAVLGAFFLLILLSMLIFHIFRAIALMTIAKKTNTPNGWLAFIPGAHLYTMTSLARVSSAFTLIPAAAFLIYLLVPYGLILMSLIMHAWTVFIYWKICEARGKPVWWSIFTFIPIVNLVFIGMLAWSD